GVDRGGGRLAGPARSPPQAIGGAPDQVAVVARARRIVARQPEGSAHATDGQRIVQRDRLEDRAQLVEAVVTPAEHAQRQIDFREGADAHRLAAARSGRREPAGAPQIVEADAFRIAWNIDAESFGAERDVRLDLRKRQLDVEAAAVSADESNDGRKPVLVAIVIDAPARLL